MRWTALTIVWAALSTLLLGAADPNTSTASFGNAAVERIRHIDEHGTLYCDLAGLPPVIGKNIPVKIKDLKQAVSAQANRNIQAFLAALFSSAKEKPKIELLNIQRGETFCLRADIRLNGKDVGQLLIDHGLAHRVLEVKEPKTTATPTGQPAQTSPASPGPASTPSKSGYFASKSSKVFHRADCYHVRRMDTSKAAHFNTRQEAIQTGRRPCKTCSP
ncbi:MAG: hypothetical protein ACYSUT_00890 [Planctomycetota bacterium]